MVKKLLIIILKSFIIGIIITAISYYHRIDYGDWIYYGYPFYYYEMVWMGTNVFNIAGLIGDISIWTIVSFGVLILLNSFKRKE
jgi:hypothetical protein